jgi:hypothetical protein
MERRIVARYILRARKFVIQKILHADDTPHAIALGTAVATFIAFLPLVGLQTVISIGLAAALRANKAVCVPIVWITNPLTLGPIYLACFGLGRWVMASPLDQDIHSAVVLNKLGQQQQLNALALEYWKDLFSRLAGLGLELWVGCAIVGVVLGIVSYLAARWGVSTYRERRRLRLLRKSLLRSKTNSIQVTRPADPG